jgi:hypothetical protein
MKLFENSSRLQFSGKNLIADHLKVHYFLYNFIDLVYPYTASMKYYIISSHLISSHLCSVLGLIKKEPSSQQ